MFFIVLGLIAAFGIQYIPTHWIRLGGYVLLAISTLLVYSTMIPGNPLVVTINGAARWVRIAGITFQPSELAKLSLIIVVADQLARIRTEEDKWKYFIRTLVIAGIVMLPIMASNLSTAVLIGLIVFCLWILARIPWKYTLSIVGIALVALMLGYAIVEFGFVRPGRQMHGPFKRATTWVSRIDRHFSDEGASKYVLTDENIQEVYSSVAIARGGTTPLGVLPGNSKERDYLPLAFADYIFAIIVEESGIIGAAFLIFLYLAILFRACNVSSRYSDIPAMLMTMGLALMNYLPGTDLHARGGRIGAGDGTAAAADIQGRNIGADHLDILRHHDERQPRATGPPRTRTGDHQREPGRSTDRNIRIICVT